MLTNVNLKIPSSELVAIVGPNGAGKSTLFNLLIGTMRPLTGEIQIFGKSIDYQRYHNKIAYVPQYEQIDWDFPISVFDVVLGGRYGHMHRFLPPAWAGKKHTDIAKQALDSVNMLEFRHRAIGALSGGQKKRVFLARALAQNADLLLFDEPLVGVDRGSEQLIFQVLKKLRDNGKSIVMITHDITSAKKYANYVVLINRTIIATGQPNEVLNYDSIQPLHDWMFTPTPVNTDQITSKLITSISDKSGGCYDVD